MYRRFFKNLSLLFLLNILIKPLWLFGIDLAVQNTVSEAEYGIYFSLLNFSLLLHIVLDLGISHYNNRAIAQDPDSLRDRFPKLVLVKAFLSVIYIIIAVAIAGIIGYDSYRLKLLILLLINQILLSYILFFRANITGLQLYRTDATLSVLDKSLMIMVIGFLLWIIIGRESFTISHFILGQMAGLLPVALFTFFIVRNRAGFEWKHSDLDWRSTLKASLPYAVLILLMTIYFRIDAVMIERLLGSEGPAQAGKYAASFRLLDAANILGYLTASFLLPMFAKHLKAKTDISVLSSFCFKAIGIIAVATCITVWIHAESIVTLLYKNATTEYAQILKILLLAFIPMSSLYITSTMLTADGKLMEQSKVALIGIAVNLVLNAILIFKYKAVGAAMATVITQFLIAILIFRMADRNYKLNIGSGYIIKISALIILGLGCGYLLNYATDYNLIALVMTFGIIILLGFILRIVTNEEVLRIMQAKGL